MMEDVIRDEDLQTYCKQNEFLFTASLPTWLDNTQVNLLEVANLINEVFMLRVFSSTTESGWMAVILPSFTPYELDALILALKVFIQLS